MQIQSIKTPTIKANQRTLEQLLDKTLSAFHEQEILVITSKIVSLCEGRVVSKDTVSLDDLIAKEADYWLPRNLNAYGFGITVKQNTLISNAGIDESNGDENYILWPKNPQETANSIRAYLCQRFNLKEVGVIISDSHVLPLRWGTMGTVIGFSGFSPLQDYRGTLDLFKRPFKVTQAGIAEGLAAAAVLVMGEGAESTPLAIISEVPFVQFQDQNPTEEDLKRLSISMEEDIFAPLLKDAPWNRGTKL